MVLATVGVVMVLATVGVVMVLATVGAVMVLATVGVVCCCCSSSDESAIGTASPCTVTACVLISSALAMVVAGKERIAWIVIAQRSSLP